MLCLKNTVKTYNFLGLREKYYFRQKVERKSIVVKNC